MTENIEANAVPSESAATHQHNEPLWIAYTTAIVIPDGEEEKPAVWNITIREGITPGGADAMLEAITGVTELLNQFGSQFVTTQTLKIVTTAADGGGGGGLVQSAIQTGTMSGGRVTVGGGGGGGGVTIGGGGGGGQPQGDIKFFATKLHRLKSQAGKPYFAMTGVTPEGEAVGTDDIPVYVNYSVIKGVLDVSKFKHFGTEDLPAGVVLCTAKRKEDKPQYADSVTKIEIVEQ